jgi:two-component system KDP operon response regulator KdpE
MTAARRVLVVSDEPGILRALEAILVAHGHAAETAATAECAVEATAAARPDAVLLDLALGGVGALEALRRIRSFDAALPVLVIGGAEALEAEALERGADEHVSYPWAVSQLLERLDSMVRDVPTKGAVLARGDVEVDIVGRHARVGGRELALTPTQFDLLVCFAARPNRTLTPRMLTAGVWGRPDAPAGANVRVFVSQLRRRLELGRAAASIAIEPGVGYRFVPGAANAA